MERLERVPAFRGTSSIRSVVRGTKGIRSSSSSLERPGTHFLRSSGTSETCSFRSTWNKWNAFRLFQVERLERGVKY